METLHVDNFLTIKSAEIEIPQFLILIGQQAQGKSVIAKLLFFFRKFLAVEFIQSIESQINKPNLVKSGLQKFEQLFPRYTWQEQEFRITYRVDTIELRLTKQGKNASIHLDYSDNLAKLHRKTKKVYRDRYQVSDETNKNLSIRRLNKAFNDVLNQYIYETEEFGAYFQESVFVPAGRIFFANLHRKVFSFLANNIDIDPLIKEFGATYETAKYVFTTIEKQGQRFGHNAFSTKLINIDVMQKILRGRYISDESQDWIENGIKRTNVSHASSGQQEALPMLLVLLAFSGGKPKTFFIEEPEAHLFPLSQKSIVELLASISQEQHRFVLTTHSPYILVAFNNLIMASNVLVENPTIDRTAVEKILGGSFWINYDDVAAYTIEDGVAVSIKDPDTRLIGESIIDEVSDTFDGIFGALLELQMQTEMVAHAA